MSFEFGATKKPGKKAGFIAKASQAPDPLAEVAYTGNVEMDAAAELSALESAFRERRKDEDKRFKQATDSEFWFAACFPSREAKDSFLAAVGAARLGDKYVDGVALAKILGVELDVE